MSNNNELSLKPAAKIALYPLILGGVILLGGIAAQIVIGVSIMGAPTEPAERFGMLIMSRVSLMLVTAYFVTLASGIAFYCLIPASLRRQRWLRVALLLFYVWMPVDIYTIVLDIRFARLFDPSQPLTDTLRGMFFDRSTALGPIPSIMLLGYLVIIGLVIFRPSLGQKPEVAAALQLEI